VSHTNSRTFHRNVGLQPRLFTAVVWAGMLVFTTVVDVRSSQAAQNPQTTRTVSGGIRTVTYTLSVKGKAKDKVSVRAKINIVGGSQTPIESDHCTDGAPPVLTEGVIEWTCTLDAESATLKVGVSAAVADSQYVSGAVLSVRVTDTGEWKTYDAEAVDGLGPALDEWFQPVFGGGFTVLQDDATDFTTTDGTLLVVDDSRLRVSALVGGLFKIGHYKTHTLSALVSLQFTQGGNTLDGFQFGGAIQLSPKIHLTLGMSRNKGKELSPGFRAAANDVIKAQVAANNPSYQRFSTWNQDSRQDNPLDGLPLNDPKTQKPFFPSAPIIESYNTAIFLGVVIPVNLKGFFSK